MWQRSREQVGARAAVLDSFGQRDELRDDCRTVVFVEVLRHTRAGARRASRRSAAPCAIARASVDDGRPIARRQLAAQPGQRAGAVMISRNRTHCRERFLVQVRPLIGRQEWKQRRQSLGAPVDLGGAGRFERAPQERPSQEWGESRERLSAPPAVGQGEHGGQDTIEQRHWHARRDPGQDGGLLSLVRDRSDRGHRRVGKSRIQQRRRETDECLVPIGRRGNVAGDIERFQQERPGQVSRQGAERRAALLLSITSRE